MSEPQGPDHPSGPPGLRQPEPAHDRRSWPGDARELPLPREDEPLRPRADPGARRARARRHGVRPLRGHGQGRRRADLQVHPRQALPGGGQAAPTSRCASRPWPAAATPPRPLRDPRGFAVKFYTEDGNWDLVGNNLGVFFIRDAIKFPDFIHSQKPDPVTFERQVANRVFDFISQSPESHAHGHAGLRPARHPGVLPDTCRASASTPTSGSTRPARPCWSSTTGTQAGREVLDRGRRRRPCRARSSASTPRTSTTRSTRGEYPEWDLYVQIMERPRAPGARLRPARRHEDRGRRTTSRCATSGTMQLNRDARRTSSPRPSRSRSAPACWSTAWTSPTTRCSSGARSPTRTRSATASARTTCSCRSTRPRSRSRPTSATAQMAYYVDETGENPSRQLRAVDHGRAERGAQAGARRAGPGRSAGGSRARRSRAPTTTSRPASATCSPSSGSGRPRREPHRRARPSATARSRSGWSGTCSWSRTSSASASARASASRADDVRGPAAARRPRADRGGARARSRTSATTARATSPASR